MLMNMLLSELKHVSNIKQSEFWKPKLNPQKIPKCTNMLNSMLNVILWLDVWVVITHIM